MTREEIIEFFKSEGKIRFDELMNLKFDYSAHFDEKKLDKFLRLAGISKLLDTPSILVNLGVAEKQENRVIFNNAGILLFARNEPINELINEPEKFGVKFEVKFGLNLAE